MTFIDFLRQNNAKYSSLIVVYDNVPFEKKFYSIKNILGCMNHYTPSGVYMEHNFNLAITAWEEYVEASK